MKEDRPASPPEPASPFIASRALHRPGRSSRYPAGGRRRLFILDDHLLSQLLQACEARNLRVGPDVGAVAINEGPLYPALKVPVSVLSADFYALGAEAAGFIANGSVPAAPVETRLTVRASLLP